MSSLVATLSRRSNRLHQVSFVTKELGKSTSGNSSSIKLNQVRNHHPSPFDPQTTKGWKAALKVR